MEGVVSSLQLVVERLHRGGIAFEPSVYQHVVQLLWPLPSKSVSQMKFDKVSQSQTPAEIDSLAGHPMGLCLPAFLPPLTSPFVP